MPERLVISAVYHAYRDFVIPKHISKDDIQEYDIHYEMLYITLKDGTELKIEAYNDMEESLDSKNPESSHYETMDLPTDDEKESDVSDDEEEEQDEEEKRIAKMNAWEYTDYIDNLKYDKSKMTSSQKWCEVCNYSVSKKNFSAHTKTKTHTQNIEK